MPLVSQSGQRTGGNAHQDDMCEIRGETDLKSYKETGKGQKAKDPK